jgi:hypothetical protein
MRRAHDANFPTVVGVVVGAALVWWADGIGAWYIPWAVALAWALVVGRPWRAFAGAWLMVWLGYAAGLIRLAASAPLMRAARLIAVIMGFGPHGAVPLVLTALLGWLLATSGAWLGLAVRGVTAPARVSGPSFHRSLRSRG